MAKRAAFVGPAEPRATVATGMPEGIWSVARRASTPFSAPPATGTPTTGSVVCAARMPPRWAAPPAAEMITLRPRPRAERA